MRELSLLVPEELDGERADKILAELVPELTRAYLQQIILDGGVSVGSKAVSKSLRLRSGALIKLSVPEPRESEAIAQNIPLDIRYEDDDLLVVNKPRGMVVHPAAGNPDSTLVNALLFHCEGRLSGINGVLRPGIIHRIDKDTSGLLLVAKTDFAHVPLAEQIREHSLLREYSAVVHGRLKQSEGTVDAPIGRSEKDRKKMCVTDKSSKNAVTHYRVLDENDRFSLVRLRLETGRTHQIRVHMAYIGHPVAGDPVYHAREYVTALGGQCLHAGLIGFVHPRTGENIRIEAELPEYFTAFLDKAGLSRGAAEE